MNPAMRDSRYLPLLAIVAVALAVGAIAARRAEPGVAEGAEVAGARFRIDAAEARRAGAPRLPAAARRAGFAFAPGTAPADREAFLGAVARARPPARRLIALVDGLTDVRIGPTGQAGALGLTEAGGKRYVVTVDLGVSGRYGARGIDRVVLHELGHVVDHALVDDAAMAPMQAGIPSGFGCEQGVSGACAAAPERFAESFAKWATGDIGVDLYVGYKVPPPAPTLEAWGAPLDRLAAAAGG
jgi:hypothetical protein